MGELLRRLDAIDRRLEKVLDDHEGRLRKLEKYAYALPPTLFVACASVAAALFK